VTEPRTVTETAETVTLAGVRTAVALLTRQQLAPDAPRGDVLDGQDPAEVLAAMEAITTGLLEGIWPADHGADLLARLGIEIARLGGD
jgi:hypothetical protein